MEIFVFFVSLFFIGSSVAYNDIQRLESLRHTTFHTEMESQDGQIQAAILKIANEGVPTAETVINSWKEKAIAAITYLTNTAIPQVRYERNQGQGTNYTGNRIIEATRKAMGLINTDGDIINEQKGSSCPIYDHFETVITTFAVGDEITQFQQDYGTVEG